MSRYEKGVCTLFVSAVLALGLLVGSVVAQPESLNPVSSASVTTSAVSSASPVSSAEPVSSEPPAESPGESEPQPVESLPVSSEDLSSQPFESAVSGTVSVVSPGRSSSSAASSSRSDGGNYTGGGTLPNISKKPEPVVSFAGPTNSVAPTPGTVSGGTVSRPPKKITRLDKAALKWIFVPILGMIAGLYILISENLRAVREKRNGAAKGGRKTARKAEDGSWIL